MNRTETAFLLASLTIILVAIDQAFVGRTGVILASLVFVVLAEMGDKTQLLAMAFSCRYRWQNVMWGVFAATAVNHLMAAAIGNYLTS